MSYLVIGAVTQAIAGLLANKLNKPALIVGSTPRVTTLPPDDQRVNEADGVNLFLYRIVQDPFTSNTNWRGDKSHPGGSVRPPLSLTLQYLLTAYAKRADGTAQDDITAHQILGNAMAILHEYPVLNDIHDSDFDASLDTQLAAELQDSFEKIKLSLAAATTDDISKIWTGLNEAFRLSVIYEVSLVQIAPTAPAPLPAPGVQRTESTVATIRSPSLNSLTPSMGEAGAEVSLKGYGLKTRGSSTIVKIGDLVLDETSLLKVTAEEIVLNIPESLQAGPKVRLSVVVDGRESAALFYVVNPWISSLQPLRGIGGIPLTIPFDVSAGTTVRVEIEGQQVPGLFNPDRKEVSATVPDTLTTNGPNSVVLLLDNGSSVRSNSLFFELLPTINSVELAPTADASQNPEETTVTIRGQRLNGQDVNVKYGDLLIAVGENTTPDQVVARIARVLEPGEVVSVLVDNRESNTIPPILESIEPTEALVGSSLTLIGKGLSGHSVIVTFGGTPVDLGSQAYASQLALTVPEGLPPGQTEVEISVNGNAGNKLDFIVLA